MKIYFVTGNQGKFVEVKSIIPEIEQLNIDLDEIQESDPKKVIEHKLLEARKNVEGTLIVEDTSFHMVALGGLPGPLIKWFLKDIKISGIAEIALRLNNNNVIVRTIFGFINQNNEISYFEAERSGQVVSPRGKNGFGWDAIFLPEGSELTYGEMTDEQKRSDSMRQEATVKLKAHLSSIK